MCCFSQLSLISEQLARLIRIDPFFVLPREICLKILGYLDGTSLCRAAQVSKRWKALGDDNVLWKGICEQHIGQRCHECGVHLPVLKHAHRLRSTSPPVPLEPQPTPSVSDSSPSRQPASLSSSPIPSLKRGADPCPNASSQPLKRYRSDAVPSCPSVRTTSPSPSTQSDYETQSSSSLLSRDSPPPPRTRPWKVVYGERMAVEHNWRRGRCKTRTLTGHTDGVMCLQFNESLSHPSFPVLISGSYDRTVRVWNMETGEQLHCLKGHRLAVRALQFDEVQLITGSMDCTLKVWNWRSGRCVRTLTGHTEGVVCLNYDSNVLASGSVDSTIKIWNLRTGRSFVLRGHTDWVNSVQLWSSNPKSSDAPADTGFFGPNSPSGCASNCNYQIDPGKMLFSASDDGTIKLWDLNARTCVRQFVGHMGQVQSLKLLYNEEPAAEDSEEPFASPSSSSSALPGEHENNGLVPKNQKPVLVSGSLDNTVKLWDIETGKATRTYFGHLEGVWAVATDKMRLVSGSHDRTVKVCTIRCFYIHSLSLTRDRYGQGILKNALPLFSSIKQLSLVLLLLKTRSYPAVMIKLSRFGASVIDSYSS